VLTNPLDSEEREERTEGRKGYKDRESRRADLGRCAIGSLDDAPEALATGGA